MKILLVEDDPVSLSLCRNFLEKLGHEVEAVDDGEKAWHYVKTKGVQIVISDWNLPGLSGLDLCRKLRNRPSHEYAYFILITTYHGDQRLTEAMDAGVDDFLTKPLDLQALTVRLRVANRILDFHRQIGTLQELLPICMYCKKIRKEKTYWENVETFFSAHTGADFTHSLCPDCYVEKVKPELDSLKKQLPLNP
ncbi:MAG: response regulator [Fibrobacterota bacterium]|nr:response regulator [Fibrobacterota bacterium]